MISKSIIVFWTLFCVWGAMSGLSSIDPALLETTGGSVGASLGLGLWIVAWGVIVGPTAVIGLLFKKKPKKKEAAETTGKLEPRIEPSISTEETKPCPQCAETVKIKAKICRYCRYEFEVS